MKVSVGGKYHIVKKNRKGEIVQEIEPFSNLILDVGLDAALAVSTANENKSRFARCFLSTETTPPSVGDTDIIGSYVESNSRTGGTYANLGASEDYAYQAISKYTFPIGSATGTWSSLAIGQRQTAGGVTTRYLWSKALIVDGLGNPIAITVLSDEMVEVYYTFTVRRDLDDGVFPLTIAGDATPRTVTFRPINVAASPTGTANSNFRIAPPSDSRGTLWNLGHASVSPTLGGITDSAMVGLTPFNWGTSPGTSRTTTYVAGSFTRTDSVLFPAAIANHANGIWGGYVPLDTGGVIAVNNPFRYQFLFSAPIMKTSLDALTLDFEFSLARL